jgi:Recombinase zinc beta ribbon domain
MAAMAAGRSSLCSARTQPTIGGIVAVPAESVHAMPVVWVRSGSGAREWQDREQPELAIVDAELWGRVQARLAGRSASFLRTASGRLIGRPRFVDVNPVHLCSGLLACARCGRAIGPVVARRTTYLCAGYHRSGTAACGNGLRVLTSAFDAALIDAVAARLEPAVVAEAVREAATLAAAGQADTATRRAAIAAELATIATRERRLLDALGDGDAAVAASIKGRLRDELSRRDALASELARLETVAPVDTDALAEAAASRAADLRGVLRRHPAQARQVLRLVVGEGRFTCTPFDDASGRGFDVQAEGDYSRLFTIRDFHTRLVRLRAIALTRSPA